MQLRLGWNINRLVWIVIKYEIIEIKYWSWYAKYHRFPCRNQTRKTSIISSSFPLSKWHIFNSMYLIIIMTNLPHITWMKFKFRKCMKWIENLLFSSYSMTWYAALSCLTRPWPSSSNHNNHHLSFLHKMKLYNDAYCSKFC